MVDDITYAIDGDLPSNSLLTWTVFIILVVYTLYFVG